MQFLSELISHALLMPDYRDWSLSKEIMKARLQLLAVFGVLGFVGAFISIWAFVLAVPPALGLAVAMVFDLFLAGGMESGRRLREKVVGVERVEAKRLEDLARLDYNGVLLSPTFNPGLRGGLWLEVALVERAIGRRIAPSLATEVGQAKTDNRKRWIASANLAQVTRAVEPVGQQFFSIWLEKTAIPYWSGLELEARKILDTLKA